MGGIGTTPDPTPEPVVRPFDGLPALWRNDPPPPPPPPPRPPPPPPPRPPPPDRGGGGGGKSIPPKDGGGGGGSGGKSQSEIDADVKYLTDKLTKATGREPTAKGKEQIDRWAGEKVDGNRGNI